MLNRWNIEVRHGLHVVYAYGRNGTDTLTGVVQSVDRRSSFAQAYGPQVTLTDGSTIGADAIKESRTQSFSLFWSPTGQRIAQGVRANSAKAAVRKAPAPYRKFLGEIYATEEGGQQP